MSVDSAAPTTGAVAPPQTPDRTESSLVEIRRDGHMVSTAAIVVLTLVATALGVTVAVVVLRIAPAPFSEVIAIGSLMLMVVLGIAGMMAAQAKAVSRLRKAVEASRGQPLAERIAAALPNTSFLWPHKLIRGLAESLAQEPGADTTLRMAPPDEATPISPIAVPFEPHYFNELHDVMESDSPDGGPRKAPPRGVRRNILLKGGWIVVVLYAVAWTTHAIEAAAKRTITPSFMMWTLVLLVFILFPVGSSWLGGRQWLAVPGALLVRKSAWLRRGWTSHVFERGRSVLVLYKLYRRQWALVAADAEACESTIGTRAEMECALAAWLSPVSPPTSKELADWL